MKKVFVIKAKESISNSFPFLWMALFLFVFFSIYFKGYELFFATIIVLFSLSVLIDTIKYCIGVYIGFVLKVDFEKREIVLNHSLLFYRKKIFFDDLIDVKIEKKNKYAEEKAYLIVSKSVHLTKQQKLLTKENDTSYKICLSAIPVDYIELLKAIFEFQSKQ
jgi:hypothetical protein